MERRPYLVGTIVGALVGGAIGYVWSSRGGRLTLSGARDLLDQFSGELQLARSLWLKVRSTLEDYQHERHRTAYNVFDVVELESKVGGG